MNRRGPQLIIFCSYGILLGITLWHHEMWRDELQSWGIVLHSNSFGDLIENKKYEGHPLLWFVLLWVASKISTAPVIMQVINYLLSLTAAGIIIFKSPFSTIQKVLIVSGYYFLYEYAAISRDYMLAVVMIMAICALWKETFKHAPFLMALFFLLCHTEMYAAIISLCLAGALFLRQFSLLPPPQKWKSVLFPIAAVAGFITSYITTVPPPDSEANFPIVFSYRKEQLVKVVGNFWNGMIPIPQGKEHFWSEPLLQGTLLAAVLGVILMVIILIQSIRYKTGFLFLLTSFFAILAFMYFKYPGFQRHYGHFFIIYLVYEWIKRYDGDVTRTFKFQKTTTVSLFYAILFVNSLMGIYFSVADWILPFSTGKQTAAFIKEHFEEDITVAGYTDCPATTVGNYLERDIYLLNNLRKSTFVLFSTSRAQPDGDVILNNIFYLADSLKSLAVVLNYPVDVNGDHPLPEVGKEKVLQYKSPSGNHSIQFRNLEYFGKSMVGGESFYIYEVNELQDP